MRFERNGEFYEWDPDKELANIKKHGVSFIEAATVFDDEDVTYLMDSKNSITEERFLAIGYSEELNMLSVCHCLRENDNLTRIISARKPTKAEIKLYGRGF